MYYVYTYKKFLKLLLKKSVDSYPWFKTQIRKLALKTFLIFTKLK